MNMNRLGFMSSQESNISLASIEVAEINKETKRFAIKVYIDLGIKLTV